MTRAAVLLAATLVAVLSPSLAAEPGKRPRLLGGLEEANVLEEGVQRALNFALSEYNKASNDRFHSRARQVLRARKQVRVCAACLPRPSASHARNGLSRAAGVLALPSPSLYPPSSHPIVPSAASPDPGGPCRWLLTLTHGSSPSWQR